MLIPLRFKYRDPANIPIRRNGSYRNRTNNSNGRKKSQDKGIAWHLSQSLKKRGGNKATGQKVSA